MEELFPALFILIIWGSIIRSTIKAAKKKQAGKSGPAPDRKTPAPRSGAGASKTKKNPWLPERDPVPVKSAEESFRVFQNGMSPEQLGASSVPGSPDPDGMPSGSLRVEHGEGYDPCHDEPDLVPSGSLSEDMPEGTDPCHDDMEPVRSTALAGAADGGEAEPAFRLGTTGNDIVQGFVWGEILNRKRA
ncbi:MAG: hypothetical protein IKE24_07825 [Clostridia bacterium]|nr:hypothetical protein [Clostridia bacterium]